MLQIQDEKVWEASKLLYNAFQRDDEKKRLDPDNITQFKREHIKPLYPHKVTEDGGIEKYGCCESCCTIDPGRFCCCNSKEPDSSFQKLGLGLCLYFKFMKHSSIVFLIIAFFTLMTCVVCYWVAIKNGFTTTVDYQTFLYSTTLGSFSSQHMKCQYQKIPTGGSSVSFTLSCPYGRLNAFGSVYSNQSLNTLYNCKNQLRAYQSGIVDYSITKSSQTSSCTSDGTSCTYTFTPSSPPSTFTTISYSYECLDETYSIGNVTAKSQYLIYGVVGIDLLCCLILTFFYCSEVKAEDQEVDYFKQQQISLDDFSIKMKGLNIATFDEEFNQIVQYFINRIGNEFTQELVQVKTPDRIDFVEYQNKKYQAYEKLTEFIAEEFFDLEVNPNSFKTSQDFIDRNFAEGKYEKFRLEFSKLISDYHNLSYNPNEEKVDKKCSIFLVVNSLKLKKRIFQMQQEGCCSKYYNVKDKVYKLSEPPTPDLIIWKNKGKWTFIRLIISWILTLAICFGSYMLFGFIQYQQNKFLSAYNFSINCDVLYTSSQMTTYSPIAGDNNYLSCFCKTNLLDFSYTQCSDWRSTYFTYLAIPIIISLFLVIYNVVVSTFFRMLSKFQSHRLISDELYSFTIKRSFLLIMNMALIMIILNMKFTMSLDVTQVSFLLQGKYNDLTPDWYINIGTIIIMTMIFNISFPIIELVMANIIKCIKHCWDRKCFCRKTSCRTKSEYIQLFSSDVYPIEERYAFLISIILITLAFSCIIPILYCICGISLILLYFSDRVLVFKVYQTPVNYGANLHKLISQVIYVGLILHFALSAFFLSEPSLVAPDSSIPANFRLDTGNQRINTILSVNYIIPYVAFFALFIGWSIFSNTLIAFCKKFAQLTCKKDFSESVSNYKMEQTFFESLSTYQISRLKMVTESEISKLAVKNRSQRMMTQNSSFMNETMKELSLNQLNTNTASTSEHQSLLRRTLMRLTGEQTLRKRQKTVGAQLIGLPSYEIMISDDAFEQDKKNTQLSMAISDILRDTVQS